MSDSESSLSDYGTKSFSKKRPIRTFDDSSDDDTFKFSKRGVAPRKDAIPADEDSDSDDSVLRNLKSIKKKSNGTKKKYSSLLDNSDSDNDADVKPRSTAKSLVVPSKASRKPKAAVPLMDSDDSDDDGGFQVEESEVLKKARMAREALEHAPIDLLDGDDDEDDGDFQMPDPIAIAKPSPSSVVPEPPATGPVIRIQFRANIASAPTNHAGKSLHGKSIVFNFRAGTKIQTVINTYRERVDTHITSSATVKFSFDGLAMNSEKTLAQHEMEDEDLVDVNISIPANAPSAKAPPAKAPPAKSSANPTSNVQYVQIKTRIKNGDPSKTHTFQLKACDPFDKLLKAYRELHGYSSFKGVRLEMNGVQMNTNNSPKDLGLERMCELDICDEEERVKQLQRMPQAATSSSTASAGAGGIALKIRINGSDKSCDTFSMVPSDSFQKLIDWVCQKQNVKQTDCKFIFDGAPLNPRGTPCDEDLEGGEVMDVQIDKDALESGNQNTDYAGAKSSSLPLHRNSVSSQSDKEASSSPPMNVRKVLVHGSLGVIITSIDGSVHVKRVDDTSKLKGKIFVGDKISHVNGKEIVGMSLAAFANWLKGVGDRRELTVQSMSTQSMETVATKPLHAASNIAPTSAKVNAQTTSDAGNNNKHGPSPTLVASTSQAAISAKNGKSSTQAAATTRKYIVAVYVIRNNVSYTNHRRRFIKIVAPAF